MVTGFKGGGGGELAVIDGPPVALQQLGTATDYWCDAQLDRVLLHADRSETA